MKIEISEADAVLLQRVADILGGSRTVANSFVLRKYGERALTLLNSDISSESALPTGSPIPGKYQEVLQNPPSTFSQSEPDLSQPLDF